LEVIKKVVNELNERDSFIDSKESIIKAVKNEADIDVKLNEVS